GDGSDGCAILRCTENKGRQRIQALFRHCAATGSARGSAWGESDRRFRPSSNRYRAYDAGASSSLSRPSHLGSFRTTLQHDTASGFSTATFRRFESGGRRFYFPSCQVGANPGEREVKSRSSCKCDPGKWPPGILRRERRFHCRSNRANAKSARHRRCFQQRRIRSNSREAVGETKRLKSHSSNAWKRSVTHF